MDYLYSFFIFFICLDNLLYQFVPYHILLGEKDKLDPLNSLEDPFISTRPDVLPGGRSIWVVSPVITVFELNPSLVRYIFICSKVVFWASSRMMKESLRVLPLMKARGAISMTPRSMSFAHLFRLHHVKKRVIEGPEIRVYFFVDISGQKAQFFSRLHGRTRKDDPADFFFQKGVDRHGHGKIGLSCSCRANTDHDIVDLYASIYCFWISVFGIMNRFFEDTGMWFVRRSLRDPSPPLEMALTAKRMSSGLSR